MRAGYWLGTGVLGYCQEAFGGGKALVRSFLSAGGHTHYSNHPLGKPFEAKLLKQFMTYIRVLFYEMLFSFAGKTIKYHV